MIITAGYIALFIGTLFEGEMVLVSAGAAARQGYLNLISVIITAWVGGIAGDHLFYVLGKCGGKRILAVRPRMDSRVQELLGMIERKQAPLILGLRFMYGFRMIVPFALGTAGVRMGLFFFLDACSGFLWSCIFSLVGYGFGMALTDVFDDPFGKIAGAVVASALVVFVLVRFMKAMAADKNEIVSS
jgi:membrane protein DedA with SNARE-associated domain